MVGGKSTIGGKWYRYGCSTNPKLDEICGHAIHVWVDWKELTVQELCGFRLWMLSTRKLSLARWLPQFGEIIYIPYWGRWMADFVKSVYFAIGISNNWHTSKDSLTSYHPEQLNSTVSISQRINKPNSQLSRDMCTCFYQAIWSIPVQACVQTCMHKQARGVQNNNCSCAFGCRMLDDVCRPCHGL